MNFTEVFEALKRGEKIKLSHWTGYWQLENGRVMMHCKNGDIIDLQDSKDIVYTLSGIASDDWQIVDKNYEVSEFIKTMQFGEAIRMMKQGKRVARLGWNGKNMSVAYQKGYPEGIPCNKQTAECWGLNEGDLFKCRPYMQLMCADGTFQMWVPSTSDVLADDWYVVG